MLFFFKHYLSKFASISKKIFLVIAVYFIVISLFAYFINKDKPKITSNPIEKNREEIYKVINDPKLSKTKEGKLTIGVYRAMMCGMVGEACTNNPGDGDKNFNKSLFGFMTNLIVLPYANPPASGVYWAYSGLQNAGFVPKTYAAGIGFNSLSAFMPIWDAFRKVAYLILVLVIITIGFMIMFRMKLNPQTVINVENALPKIVVTLILITFSYAIVGFAIDLMYLVILLGIEIIGKAGSLPNIPQVQNSVVDSNIFSGVDFGNLFWMYYNGVRAIISLLPPIIGTIIQSIIGLATLLILMNVINPLREFVKSLFGDLTSKIGISLGVSAEISLNIATIIAAIISLAVGGLLGYLISFLLIAILVIFGLLFLLFRILFVLLSSLIQIILYLVFAPLLIMLEAIPGRSSFSGWLKNIVGNLIAFPAVVFLILITSAINQIYHSNQPTFAPPFLGGLNSDALAPLINAVMLLMIPDLVKALKQAIIGKEGLQLPISPGALFAAGGAALGTVSHVGQQIYYFDVAKRGLGGLFGSLLSGFGKKSPSGPSSQSGP